MYKYIFDGENHKQLYYQSKYQEIEFQKQISLLKQEIIYYEQQVEDTNKKDKSINSLNERLIESLKELSKNKQSANQYIKDEISKFCEQSNQELKIENCELKQKNQKLESQIITLQFQNKELEQIQQANLKDLIKVKDNKEQDQQNVYINELQNKIENLEIIQSQKEKQFLELKMKNENLQKKLKDEKFRSELKENDLKREIKILINKCLKNKSYIQNMQSYKENVFKSQIDENQDIRKSQSQRLLQINK